MKKLLYILLFTPVALFGQSIISIEQDVPLELQSGWNMFGYSCYEPIDVAIAFTSIVDKIVIVKDNSGNVYMPEFGFNGIGGLHINRGYQIKLTEAITDFQFCSILVPFVEGCVDETAFNYNSSANMDDGSCEYIGCMDDNAENYDSIATINNDACVYSGCMDAEADNYNPNATLPVYPPNFCEYLGCLDVNAFNFDPTANLDDSSCEYPIDTLFYYDCHNILFIENESDAEIFDLMINDFDEGITPIFEGEGSDVLDAFSSFFLTYNSTPMYNAYNTSPPTA
ncbi:MAG: hypothetical protein ACJ0QR_01065, partial [Flavobacteriales bacterium]